MNGVSRPRYGRIILTTMHITFYQNVFDGFILFTILVQPLLTALLGLWILRGKGAEYGIYVVVGSGMAGLWSSLLFISGNAITMERWFGTLETLTGLPTPLQTIVTGKILANVLQSLISMVVTYIMASLIFGYPLKITSPALFAVSLLLTVGAFLCFGLIIAPLFILNPHVQHWQNGIEFPVYVLSGFLFPILLLPLWSHPFSWVLPTYWAARALHIAAEGGEAPFEVYKAWLILGLIGTASLLFSRSLFTTVIKRAKTNGSLDAK